MMVANVRSGIGGVSSVQKSMSLSAPLVLRTLCKVLCRIQMITRHIQHVLCWKCTVNGMYGHSSPGG